MNRPALPSVATLRTVPAAIARSGVPHPASTSAPWWFARSPKPSPYVCGPSTGNARRGAVGAESATDPMPPGAAAPGVAPPGVASVAAFEGPVAELGVGRRGRGGRDGGGQDGGHGGGSGQHCTHACFLLAFGSIGGLDGAA